MQAAIRQRVVVQPGGVVEVRSPELTPGASAEVIVLVESSSMNGNGDAPAQSPALTTWEDFIGSGSGRFKSVEEVDAYVRELRDEWDR